MSVLRRLKQYCHVLDQQGYIARFCLKKQTKNPEIIMERRATYWWKKYLQTSSGALGRQISQFEARLSYSANSRIGRYA